MDIADIIAKITKAAGRKSLYHFTRARNLEAIAHFDALWSSCCITADVSGERRLTLQEATYEGYTLTVNSHLRIPQAMMKTGWTVERFRASLDNHVFFWPTRRDCLAMLGTYKRREPDERFAVLEFDAAAVLAANRETARLSKYDSGSAPRFPLRTGYRKSPDMFLPLAEFGRLLNNEVPAKASEIKEVLIEDRVNRLTRFLRAIYVQDKQEAPERWSGFAAAIESLYRPLEP
ncbi:DUF7002 family protein [Paenibacillus glycinis]|uniref:DarT domain-containing protein n=1 Tax=Paenibacillus glycinis TaxID=2697035 RepID=A0ABW9XLN5_9BACL|nr:hypothetical protein [Paenibacillus glycinis]NBD23530.1 hypothetical protein [Paenibacillus glycinis]